MNAIANTVNQNTVRQDNNVKEIHERSRQIALLKKNLTPEVDKEKKLREACEGFESIFIQKMWEQMRATVPKGGLLQGKEEQHWQTMFDQELAKKMTSAGGIGIADMMYEQLSRNLVSASRTTASAISQQNLEKNGQAFSPAPISLMDKPAKAQKAVASADKLGAAGLYEEAKDHDSGNADSRASRQHGANHPAAVNGAAARNAASEADGTPPEVQKALDALRAKNHALAGTSPMFTSAAPTGGGAAYMAAGQAQGNFAPAANQPGAAWQAAGNNMAPGAAYQQPGAAYQAAGGNMAPGAAYQPHGNNPVPGAAYQPQGNAPVPGAAYQPAGNHHMAGAQPAAGTDAAPAGPVKTTFTTNIPPRPASGRRITSPRQSKGDVAGRSPAIPSIRVMSPDGNNHAAQQAGATQQAAPHQAAPHQGAQFAPYAAPQNAAPQNAPGMTQPAAAPQAAYPGAPQGLQSMAAPQGAARPVAPYAAAMPQGMTQPNMPVAPGAPVAPNAPTAPQAMMAAQQNTVPPAPAPQSPAPFAPQVQTTSVIRQGKRDIFKSNVSGPVVPEV